MCCTAPDCLYYMQNGSELVKVRSNGRQYHRLFTLDTDLKEIRWHPSSKKPHKAKSRSTLWNYDSSLIFSLLNVVRFSSSEPCQWPGTNIFQPSMRIWFGIYFSPSILTPSLSPFALEVCGESILLPDPYYRTGSVPEHIRIQPVKCVPYLYLARGCRLVTGKLMGTEWYTCRPLTSAMQYWAFFVAGHTIWNGHPFELCLLLGTNFLSLTHESLKAKRSDSTGGGWIF